MFMLKKVLILFRNIFIGTVLMFVLLIGVSVMRTWLEPRAPFVAAIWKHHDQNTSDGNPRKPMLRDLERRHLKPGMTRRQIIALLGPTHHGESPAGSGGTYLSYELGSYGRSFGHSTFRVFLDKNGRYTHSDIQED